MLLQAFCPETVEEQTKDCVLARKTVAQAPRLAPDSEVFEKGLQRLLAKASSWRAKLNVSRRIFRRLKEGEGEGKEGRQQLKKCLMKCYK